MVTDSAEHDPTEPSILGLGGFVGPSLTAFCITRRPLAAIWNLNLTRSQIASNPRGSEAIHT